MDYKLKDTMNEKIASEIADYVAKTREETAKEIFDKMYEYGQDFFYERSFMEEDEFNGILDEIKKQFFVELLL